MYKIIKIVFISVILIFLLCSCNNDNISNVDGKVENQDNILQSNITIDEVLDKVKDEVEAVTGLDGIEVSEFLNFDDIYFVKVKIPNKVLDYNFEYNDRYDNEDKTSCDLYEIWRYEKDVIKRILYNLENVVHYKYDDNIYVLGAYNDYVINVENDNEGKQEVVYECYYTDKLNSDNGEFTCYINGFYSVCVVNNKIKEIVLNKYIDNNNEKYQEMNISEEDFILDNNRAFFEHRYAYPEKSGWIKNSNIAYYFYRDIYSPYVLVDIDNNVVMHISADYNSYLNDEYGYLVSGNTNLCQDRYNYMNVALKKQNSYISLFNLHTFEKIEIGKSFSVGLEAAIENNEKSISYTTIYGEKVTVNLPDMIDSNRKDIIDGYKTMLSSKYDLDKIELKQLIKSNDKYYQIVKINISENEYKYQLIDYIGDNYEILIDFADNIKLNKFNDNVYAYVEDGENTRFIQYTEDGNENIIEGKFDDINFSELNKYISLYKNNGDIIVLDSKGNKYFEENIYDDVLNNLNLSVNDNKNRELDITIWGKDSETLYILTKKGDMLGNIFEVNLLDKSVKNLALGIDCLYDNLYINPSRGYIVYNTYPYKYTTENTEKFNEEVNLCLKYFNSDEIINIGHVKGENIKFGIYNNVLDYIYRENNEYVEGHYTIPVLP